MRGSLIGKNTSRLINRSLTPVHEREDLDPSHPCPLRQVYYRRRRELRLMTAGIGNARGLGPLDTDLL
jgi:hypothetical protein